MWVELSDQWMGGDFKMGAEIMIVDDEAAIADLIDVYLQNEGYTVHKFYNATQALECVEHERLDTGQNPAASLHPL